MNKVTLLGRLVKDPEVRYSAGDQQMAVARYTLAVDRRVKKEGSPTADFINCIAFGRIAENAEKYLAKGRQICVHGRIQTGSYTNKDGQKVYTTEVVIEDQEFVGGKKDVQDGAAAPAPAPAAPTGPVPDDGFMNIPDGIDEELPFN